MSNNLKKEATLGMSFGKVAQRLRKNILFHLVVKLKENFCFKCGLEISKVEELSIEHKLPWEGRSDKLFWDLDNIAFSHLKCNRPHVHGGGRKRIVPPEGTVWCSGHKIFLSVNMFYKKVSTPTGYQVNCRECYDIKRGRKEDFNGRLAQLGERRTCNAEAIGAEPILSTIGD